MQGAPICEVFFFPPHQCMFVKQGVVKDTCVFSLFLTVGLKFEATPVFLAGIPYFLPRDLSAISNFCT